jgi:hypothetical protein
VRERERVKGRIFEGVSDSAIISQRKLRPGGRAVRVRDTLCYNDANSSFEAGVGARCPVTLVGLNQS